MIPKNISSSFVALGSLSPGLEQKLEQEADSRKFFRIHRSTIVNLAWIKEATSLPGGALNIRLKDVRNPALTVARDRTREFQGTVIGGETGNFKLQAVRSG